MKTSKATFVQNNLKEDTGFLLLQLSHLWDNYHERVLKKHYRFSSVQYAVLASVHWCVMYSDKEVTQSYLAHHTKINPMTISQVLGALEKKGYISRKPHSTDTRANAVTVTPKGEELLKDAILLIAKADAKFFNILGEKNTKIFNKFMVELIEEND